MIQVIGRACRGATALGVRSPGFRRACRFTHARGEPPYSLRAFLPICVVMTPALVRTLPSARTAMVLVGLLLLVSVWAASTGFGATTSTQLPNANVLGTLSMTDPTIKNGDPAVCTDAVAPLDTDNCGDTSFAGTGASKVLRLGALSGTDVQAASLTWTVSTTNPTGYVVRMSNAGTAPLLRSSGGTIADMSTTSLVPQAAVDDATHFGVAMGNATSDSEPVEAAFVSSGQQAELFSGIPTAGMDVCRRTVASTDPCTATFAAASVSSSPPPPGSYAGTVRMVASAL